MESPPKQSPESPASEKGGVCRQCDGLMWWTTLVVAVIAVPIIGASLALALTKSAFAQMVIFVLACWASVWLGMWLKHKADGARKPPQ